MVTHTTRADGSMTPSSEPSPEKIAADLAAVAAEAGDLVRNVSARNLRRAQVALADARAALRDGGNELAGGAGDYVRAHPLQALGAAAVAGMVLGALIARR